MYSDDDHITIEIKKLIEQDQAKILDQVLNAHPVLVDRRDLNERTWMHEAAEQGTWSCLEVLFNHGLDINAQNVMGETPLHRALTRHRQEATDWFLEKGADLNLANAYGATPTLYAAGWSNDILAKMIERGGDPDVKDKHGDGIEQWAQRGVRTTAQVAKLARSKKSSSL